MEFLRKIIEENCPDYLTKFNLIFDDPDSMIKIYSTKSRINVIARNMELRLDSFTPKVKEQALMLLSNLNKYHQDEVIIMEIFGAQMHYIVYLNASLTNILGKLEILGTKINDLLSLESKYQKLGLKLDGVWKPLIMEDSEGEQS